MASATNFVSAIRFFSQIRNLSDLNTQRSSVLFQPKFFSSPISTGQFRYGSSVTSFSRDSSFTQKSKTSKFRLNSLFSFSSSTESVKENSIYEFTVKDIDGNDVSLTKFKGKVILIINVASKCGLTSSNYSELSHLYSKYKNQGFEILAFPCNQFGGQEPGTLPEIKQFACSRFRAEFPIFDKVEVNGPDTAPIYRYLKSNAGGFFGSVIKWNFEKFLVDKNGKVFERYAPTTSPFQIEKDILKLLGV